jgi:hypothetical protein
MVTQGPDDQLRETKVSTKLTQCRPKSHNPGFERPHM